MNKLNILLIALISIALVSVFSLAGCGQAEQVEQVEGEVEEAVEEEPSEEPFNLVWWWWGEQHAPGMTDWIEESARLFEDKYPHITVETTLLSTDVVMTQYPNAAAVGEGPDIGFAWDGVYFIPWVWLGYVEPLEELIPQENLKNMVTQQHSVFDGHVWSVGMWDDVMCFAENRKVFEDAGVEPVGFAPEYDDFLSACKELKEAGVTPIGMGAKDLFSGEHLFSYVVSSGCSSMRDLADLAEQTQLYTDEKYVEGWEKWKELYDLGYINPDFFSLTMEQGLDLFTNGDAAIAEVPMSVARYAEEQFGEGSMGIINLPKISTGGWAGQNGWGCYGNLFINSGSEHKEEAAEFLMFLHSPERMDAMWKDINVVPADLRFDYSQLSKPFDKQLYEKIIKPWQTDSDSYGFWVSLIIPCAVMDDIGYGVFPELFIGDMTPEELGQAAQDSLARWASEDPDFYQKHVEWMHEMVDNYSE